MSTEDNNLPKSSIEDYELSESKQELHNTTVSIMDLKLEDLIYEKMYLLFEKLQPSLNKLESSKINYKIAKEKLLLETDFKKELNENRVTVSMKEAYITPLLTPHQVSIDKSNDDVVFYKNKLNILNDLIKHQRLLLEIEGALHK